MFFNLNEISKNIIRIILFFFTKNLWINDFSIFSKKIYNFLNFIYFIKKNILTIYIFDERKMNIERNHQILDNYENLLYFTYF